jgi:CO dehydrogenase/acetyl-CoA synthase beta subunit
MKRVATYVDEARARGRPVKEFLFSGDPLPVRVGPGANPGIVLRGDTFAELGSPDTGSCALPLWTDDPSLIQDGRIRLIGPGIQESPGASLPFAQVVVAGGKELGEEEHATLEQCQYVSDRVEGYMIRSMPGRMWSRISKEVAGKGFDFDVLGSALISIFKSEMPKIEAMEVLFVTTGKEDLEPLNAIAVQIETIGKYIEKKTWLAKGFDLECTMGVDCKSCTDKPVCDDVRDVVKIRKRRTKKVV